MGDIGGTRCNFAVAAVVEGNVKLVASLHLFSKEITRFVDAVSGVLEHFEKTHGIIVDRACFAVAGPIRAEDEVVRLTNLDWKIDVQELKAQTLLKTIKLINDFEAIGYGIDLIDQKDVVCVCEGERMQKQQGRHYFKSWLRILH